MGRRALLPAVAGIALAGSLLAGAAMAQQVTLKVQHFLPPAALAQTGFIKPWADALSAQSGGRIKVEIYPAMQLGGRPPQLFDQVREGFADVVWTLPGYTPGRFPIAEVFELPFMAGSAEATSQAVMEFATRHLMAEFKDVHPLLFHVHASGLFHMKDKPVAKLEDLKGLKVRAPTRTINDALAALGATPVGMPVPQVPEALSKGVIDGAVIPFEVAVSLKVQELVKSHSYVVADRGLYTSVFLFAMNKAKYDGLPADLKKVIDANSGMNIARRIGKVWDEGETPGINAAKARGNTFLYLPAAEVERFKAATRPVIDKWIADMTAKGVNGKALYDEAVALVAKYSKGS
ncbi:MAG: TRAP transporter substrate-binding protein [Thalassobaculales bacterium]